MPSRLDKFRIFARDLEEFLWLGFLIAIPLQTRIILLQPDWYFNEWRSMFLYATDVLFLLLIILWCIRHGRSMFTPLKTYDWFLILFITAAVFSLAGTTNRSLSMYALVRLLESILFYWYVRTYVLKRFSVVASAWALVAGGIVQAMIGIGQFMSQSNLGFSFLGETLLNPNLNGVAVFINTAGARVMRAYGTTPHPNILAAYLLVSLGALYYLFLKNETKIFRLLFPVYGVLLFAFFLTFSRTTIFIWLAAFCGAMFFTNIKSKKRKLLAGATIIITILFVLFFWQEVWARLTISSHDEAVTLRLYYNQQALSVGGGHKLNWTGVGVGNFVNWLMEHQPNHPRYLYQPAHNVFLLVYSEMGILGLMAFFGFLFSLLWSYARPKIFRDIYSIGPLLLALCFLGIGLFDHFPWTLQQGRLLFWGVLGYLAGIDPVQEKSPQSD